MRNYCASHIAPAAVIVAIVVAALAANACGSPTVTPPVVVNTEPTIESIVTSSARAEAEQPIQVTAVFMDLESTPDRLTFTWSASPQTGTFGGTTTFTGNQAINTWRAPKGHTTPDVYTITLTVTEAYTSAGQAKQNIVSKSTTVRYNDSPAETIALATQFIKDFGTFTVSPDQCVRNFSANCRGKQDELEDIQDNREKTHILSSILFSTVVTFNDAFTGTVEGPCQFEDIPGPGEPNAGLHQFVSGTCVMTTVYEDFRWYLCESTFLPPHQTTVEPLKGRVPGRIVFR